jgi:Xaa-Pro aminopeptidase
MNKQFFINNRNALVNSTSGGVIVLSAYTRLQRSNDAAFKFVQESNFWYLCGIDEPDWTLIIDGSQDKSWLVMPQVSDIHMIFDGGLSADYAKQISGVDRVITSDEANVLLQQIAKRHSMVNTISVPSYADHFNFYLNPAIMKNWRALERKFSKVHDIQKDIAKMRAIKQPEELHAIQHAVDITKAAFNEVYQHFKDYKFEYEIESAFGQVMRRNGANGHAYDPIIAAGNNACTLHYAKNHSKLSSRQLVLMDVGASYGGYAADISRTYAHGAATKRQKEVHEAVRNAHYRIIELIAPGVSVQGYQELVDKIMTEALDSIRLDSSEKGLRRYFPHAISHGLGIDVHDSLGAPKYFAENMVLTVEPGIYIPEENIGVRIEDDILVTKQGSKNMSGSLSTEL